ncbi:hypothetical protein CRUP_038170 [Coryphaenoides rupestris]|nr:hypothetical protein CRUP_038170 [Coryphaenoides rupestris]
MVTRGCEALEVTPLRDGVGQPGFLMSEEGFVTDLQRFCYAESGGLQLCARVVRLCGRSLVHLSPDERSRLLRTAHKIHITVIPPDENGKPRRDEDGEEEEEEEEEKEEEEEVTKTEQQKPGDVAEAETVEVDVEVEVEVEVEVRGEEEEVEVDHHHHHHHQPSETRGSDGDQGTLLLLSPPSLPLLRATSLQDPPPSHTQDCNPSLLMRSVSLERQPPFTDTCDDQGFESMGVKVEGHIYENPRELRDATPDLIPTVKPKLPLDDQQFLGAEFGEERASASDGPLSASRLSCLDRADRNSRALSLHNSITKILSETTESTEEEWQSISDLAAACRGILEALSREVLRDEKDDKAMLQAEVQSLRQNNQRLQEESQSTVARLIKVTELLCNQ